MNLKMNTAILIQNIKVWLMSWIHMPGANVIVSVILLMGIALCAVAGYYLTTLLLRIVAVIVSKTRNTWDDDLLDRRFLRAFSQITPALIVSWMLPLCFAKNDAVASFLNILTSFYIIWATVYFLTKFIDNLHDALAKRKKYRAYAVKGIFQMIKLIFIGLGIVIGISLLVGKSPVAILTALGASAAILTLVFKDTILGLVASVQLTANKMLHKGDWIIAPSHDANGEVLDISLTTVKVRNWDNSITTIPPYSLISESFQNYQAMRRMEARRICRSVYIDINSIRFLRAEEIDSLVEEGWFEGISVEEKMVNIRLFRHYLENWIKNHPHVRTDLLFMVRQMQAGSTGLPLELYFFVKDTEWKAYERIQSDMFDHVYAVARRFGIVLFQSPSDNAILALK